MIDRAVILAAGRGTRLGALTANYPKPLLEVGGEPILARVLRGLGAAGIKEAAIVTGHFGNLIQAELGRREAGIALTYLHQPAPEGTARALAVAREWLGDDSFFFTWGDILVQPANYASVLDASDGADAVIAVNEVDDPWAGAAVYLDDDFLVTSIVEKPAPGTSTTRWNNAGFGVLTPLVWEYVDDLEPSPRGEYELPAALSAMVEAGHVVRAVPVSGPWFDIGTPADLERARARYPERRR